MTSFYFETEPLTTPVNVLVQIECQTHEEKQSSERFVLSVIFARMEREAGQEFQNDTAEVEALLLITYL